MSQQPHERTPNPADESLTPPLGHQNPLGLHYGLGQINLQTKGLGGSSLAVLDPDIFFPNGLPEIASSDVSDEATAAQQSAPSPEQATPATPSIQPQRIRHSQGSTSYANQALQRQSGQPNQQPSSPQSDEYGQSNSNTANDNQALQQQSGQPNQPIQPQRIEHNLNTVSDANQALQRQSSQPNQQLESSQQPQINPTSSQTRSQSNPTIQPISGRTAHQSSAHHTDFGQSSDIIQRSSNEPANQAKASPQIKPLSGQVQPTLDSSLSANIQAKELSGASTLTDPNEPNSASSQSAEPAQLGAAEPISKVQSQSANEQQQAPPTTASNPKPPGKPTHTDIQRYFDPETESSASKNFSDRTISGSGEQVVQAKSSADKPSLDVAESAEARLVSDAQPTHETASEDAIAQVQPSLTVSNDSISRSALEISSHADQPAVDHNLSVPSNSHSEESPTATEFAQQAPSIQRSTASSSHSSQTSSTHQPPEATASGTTTPAELGSANTSEQANIGSNAASQTHFSNQADTVINRKVESLPTLDSPAITAENPLPINSNLTSPKSTPIQRQPEALKVNIQSGSEANLDATTDATTIVDAHSNPEINTDTTTTLDTTVTPAPQNTIHRSPFEQEAQIAEQQSAQPPAGSAEASKTRSHSDTPIQQSSAESEQPPTATRQERSFLQRYFTPEPNSSASSPASSNSPHSNPPDDSQSSINQSASKSEQLHNQPAPEIAATSQLETTINRSVEPSNISSAANPPEHASSTASAPRVTKIQRQPSSDGFDGDVRSQDHSSPDLDSQPSLPSTAETQAAQSNDRSTSSVHPAPASGLEHLQLKPADTAQINSTDIKETKTTNLQRQPADAAQISDPGVEETKGVSLPVTSALNQIETSSIQAKSQVTSDDVPTHAVSPKLPEVHEAHLAPSHKASQSDGVLQRDMPSSATTDNIDLHTPPQIKEEPDNQTAPSNSTNTLTDRPSIASTDLPSIQAQFDQVNTQTTDQSDQPGNQQLESVPVYSNQINIQKQSDSTTNNQPNSDSSEFAQAINNESKLKKSEAQLSANQSIDFVQPKFDITANQNSGFVQSKSQVSGDQSVKPTQPRSSSDQPTKPIQKVGHAVNRLMRFFASQVNPAPNHQINQSEHTAPVEIQKSELVNASDTPSQTPEIQASDTESILVSHSNSSSAQRSHETASDSTKFESPAKLDNDAPLRQSSTESGTAISAEPVVSEQLTSDAISLKADPTGADQHSSSELSGEQSTLGNQDTFVEPETAIAPLASLAPTTASQVTSNIQAKLDRTAPDNPQISPAEVSESLSDKTVQASDTNVAVDSLTSSAIGSSVDIDVQTPTADPVHAVEVSESFSDKAIQASATNFAVDSSAPVHASAESHTESQSTASDLISSAAETDGLSAALAEPHSQPSQPVSPDIIQRSEQAAAKTFTDSPTPPAELVHPAPSSPSSGSAGQPDLTSDSTPALGDHFSNQLSSSLANDAIQTKADSVQSVTDSASDHSDHAATVEPRSTSAESTTPVNQPSAIAADSASIARLPETPQEQPLQRQTEETSSSTASQAELPDVDTASNLDAQPIVQRTSALDETVSNQAEASASVEALAASANALPSQDSKLLQAHPHEPADTQTARESTSQANTEIHETHSAELTQAALPGEQSMLQRQLSTELPDLNPTSYSTDADTSAPIAPSADPPSVQLATEVPDLNPTSYSTADTSAPVAPSAESPSIQRADQAGLDSHTATSQSLTEASTEAPASSAQLLQRTTAEPSESSSTDELSSNLSPTSQPSSSNVKGSPVSHQEPVDAPKALPNNLSRVVPDVQASGSSETTYSPKVLPDQLSGAAPSVQLSSASVTQNSFTSVQPSNQPDIQLQHDTQQLNQQSESVEPSSSTTISASSATPDAAKPIAVQRQTEDQPSEVSSSLASAFTTEALTTKEDIAGAIASASAPTLLNETVQRFSDLSAASLDSDQAAQPLNTANHNNSEHHSDSLPSAASELNLSSVQRLLADQNINQSTDAIAPSGQSSADQPSTNSPPQSHSSSEAPSAANVTQEPLESLPAGIPSIQASSVQKSEDQSAINAPQESLESLPAGTSNIQASSIATAETLHSAQFDQTLPEEQPPELPSAEAPSIQASSVPTAETLHSAQFDQVLPEALSDKAPSIQASESSVTPSHTPEQPLQPQTTLDAAPLSSSNTALRPSFSSESTSAPESVAEIEPQPQSSAQINAALHSGSTQTPSIQAQSTPINAGQPDLKHPELNQLSAQSPSIQAQPAQADSTPAGSEQSGSTYSALQLSSTQVPSVQAKSAQAAPEQSPEQSTIEHLRPLQSPRPPSIQAKSAQAKTAHVAADPNQQVDQTPITVLRPIGVLRSLTTTPISTSAVQAKASQSKPSQQLPTAQLNSSNQNIDSNLSSSYQAQSHTEKGLAANVGFPNSTASQPVLQRQPAIADPTHNHDHHEPNSAAQPGQSSSESSNSHTATPISNQGVADIQRQSADSTHQVDLTQTVLDGIDQAANRDRTSNSTAQLNSQQPADSPTISQVTTDQPHQSLVNRSLADVADSVDSVIDQQSNPSQSLADTPSSQGFSTPTADETGHQLDSYQAGTYNLQASPQANQSGNPPAAQLSATPTQPNLVQRADAEQSEQARPTQTDQASTHIQRAQAADVHQTAEPLSEYIQPVNSQPNNIQRDQLSDSSQPKATAQPVQPFTQAQPSHIQRTQAASTQPSDLDQDAGVPTQWSSLADLVDQTQRLSAPTSAESSPEKVSSIPEVQRQVDLPSVAEPKNIQDSATDALLHEAATSIAPSPSASIPTQWSSLEDLVQKMPSLEPAADSPIEEAKATSQMPQIQRQSLSQETSRSSHDSASPSPKSLQSKSQSTLQPVRQPSKPRSTLSVSRVAPSRSQSALSTQTTVQAKFSQSRPNPAMLIQADADAPFVTISRSGGNSEPSADYAEALELLAQEIYSLLRQRLAIEQERHGAGYPNRFR